MLYLDDLRDLRERDYVELGIPADAAATLCGILEVRKIDQAARYKRHFMSGVNAGTTAQVVPSWMQK